MLGDLFQKGHDAAQCCVGRDRPNPNGQKREKTALDKAIRKSAAMDHLFAMALGKTSRYDSSRVHGPSLGRRYNERQTFQLLPRYSRSTYYRSSPRFTCSEKKKSRAAIENARNAILIEVNGDYIPIIERECDVTPGLALQ